MNRFPQAALAQHIAILGKTGSGKSYAARGIVEQLLEEQSRVCIIDPTGVWHGLRSSATGKSAGYPVVIFGGNHADLPLAGAHGEAIAETIGTSSTPAIIDTSLMKVGERTRFFADFADALIRKNKGPLHLIIDEAHLFAPQGKVNDPQSGAMLHAANNLVSLGRSRGLRIILISQRPAKLHKDSLTQVETLVAMRLIAPQDRHAVEEWIEDNADEAKGREIIRSLAQLGTGYGWVWAPEIGILEQIHFPKIRTFDSGRAPDGTEQAGQVLAPIDREAIAERLKAVAADAIANDPAVLKKKVADLERQLKTAAGSPALDPAAVEEAREAGYQLGRQHGQQHIVDQLEVFYASHERWLNSVPPRPVFHIEQAASSPPRPPSRPGAARFTPVKTPVKAGAKPNGHARPVDLPKGEVAVLSACIQYPDGLKREQITILTGFKRSTRDAYIYRLRERGFVDINGEVVTATETGFAALPDAEPLPTGAELQRFWLEKLPQGERRILECLIEAYPKAMTRDELTERTEFKRSTRDAYLYRMAGKQLIAEPARGEVRAAETLF